MVNDEVEPTERIVELVHSGKVPEQYEQVLSYGNVKTLRAEMEKHALVALPWDDIFGPAEAICDEAGFPQLEDDPEAPEVDRPAPVVEGVETLPCDTCKKEISATATTCPHCGTEYEVEQTPDVQGQPEPGFAGDDIPFS